MGDGLPRLTKLLFTFLQHLQNLARVNMKDIFSLYIGFKSSLLFR